MEITLFLGGDVMTGRGIDQVLPHPSDPAIHEAYMKSAAGYVDLAERAHGSIARPVDPAYPWGDALAELRAAAPDVRIVNLETAVTASDRPWPGKGIHYRMHPGNVGCLTAAGIDCCALANNHTLDWSRPGLEETLETLRGAGILTAGAGMDLAAARRPAVMEVPGKGRVKVYSVGVRSSGIPAAWSAGEGQAGINALPDLAPASTAPLAVAIRSEKKAGDVVVVSIHWGGNWGYVRDAGQRAFAQRLIEAGVDVVHGHSSHHAKGIEVIGGRPVLYGCGDLINDYEGITGSHDSYRDDLPLLYFVTLDARTGALRRLEMVPMRIRNFRLGRASAGETQWLHDMLNREGRRLNTSIARTAGDRLQLQWG